MPTSLRKTRESGRGGANHVANRKPVRAQAFGVEVDQGEVRRVIGEFTGLWLALTGRERSRAVEVLVERVAVADNGLVDVALRER